MSSDSAKKSQRKTAKALLLSARTVSNCSLYCVHVTIRSFKNNNVTCIVFGAWWYGLQSFEGFLARTHTVSVPWFEIPTLTFHSYKDIITCDEL